MQPLSDSKLSVTNIIATDAPPSLPSAANNILMDLLGTDSTAGLVTGGAASIFLVVAVCVYLQWQALP